MQLGRTHHHNCDSTHRRPRDQRQRWSHAATATGRGHTFPRAPGVVPSDPDVGLPAPELRENTCHQICSIGKQLRLHGRVPQLVPAAAHPSSPGAGREWLGSGWPFTPAAQQGPEGGVMRQVEGREVAGLRKADTVCEPLELLRRPGLPGDPRNSGWAGLPWPSSVWSPQGSSVCPTGAGRVPGEGRRFPLDLRPSVCDCLRVCHTCACVLGQVWRCTCGGLWGHRGAAVHTGRSRCVCPWHRPSWKPRCVRNSLFLIFFKST